MCVIDHLPKAVLLGCRYMNFGAMHAKELTARHLQLCMCEVGGQLCSALGVLVHIVLLRVLPLYLAAQTDALLPVAPPTAQPH